MNLKSLKESWLGDVLEFVLTAGTGALVAKKLEGHGFSKEASEKLGQVFETHFMGFGKQDEVNNWLALCGLFHFE